MKRYTFLIKCLLALLCCSVLPNSIQAESIEQVLKKANDAYAQEDYNKAVDLYERVVKQQNGSADLYYNLGNAYYKAGFNAQALLWYERALRLNPSDEDIRHNIAFVNQKITDKIDPLPQTTLLRIWNSCAHTLSERQWAILSILFSTLVMLCVAGYLFSRPAGLRISSFVLFWIALVALLLSIVFANKVRLDVQQKDEAIVTNMVAEVKSAPADNGRTIFVIHEGLKVQIVKELKGYVEIRIPSGEKGWISKSEIEKI